MCCLSCQGSSYFATLFASFENMCKTSSVRQAVPLDRRNAGHKLSRRYNVAGAGLKDISVANLGRNWDMTCHV